MEINVRRAWGVGYFVEVKEDVVIIDLGVLNHTEAAELAEHLREVADELAPEEECGNDD